MRIISPVAGAVAEKWPQAGAPDKVSAARGLLPYFP